MKIDFLFPYYHYFVYIDRIPKPPQRRADMSEVITHAEVQRLLIELNKLKTKMNLSVIARAEMHAREASSAGDDIAASCDIAAYQEARWKLAEALGCSYADPRLL